MEQAKRRYDKFKALRKWIAYHSGHVLTPEAVSETHTLFCHGIKVKSSCSRLSDNQDNCGVYLARLKRTYKANNYVTVTKRERVRRGCSEDGMEYITVIQSLWVELCTPTGRNRRGVELTVTP